jgi:hypothetical protein
VLSNTIPRNCINNELLAALSNTCFGRLYKIYYVFPTTNFRFMTSSLGVCAGKDLREWRINSGRRVV